MLEKPPAMKNRGMTCSSHVASCSAGIEVKALAQVAGGGRTCMSSFWPPGGSGLPGFAHPQQDQDLGHHHVLDLVGVDALVGSVDPREGEVFGAPEQDVG